MMHELRCGFEVLVILINSKGKAKFNSYVWWMVIGISLFGHNRHEQMVWQEFESSKSEHVVRVVGL